MLGASWLYWILFAIAALGWIAVPLVARWEHHQDQRDRELFERVSRYIR